MQTTAAPASQQQATHTYRPHVTISDNHTHAWQRRYGENRGDWELNARHDDRQVAHCTLAVFRDSGEDVAELRVQVGLFTTANMAVRLAPAELRNLAARALDAAHDIETNPAAALAAQALKGGAA